MDVQNIWAHNIQPFPGGFVEIKELCFERSTVISRTNIKLCYDMARHGFNPQVDLALWIQANCGASGFFSCLQGITTNYFIVLMLQVIDCIRHITQIQFLFWDFFSCLSVKNIQQQGVVIWLKPSSFCDILVCRYNFNIIQSIIVRVNGLFKPLSKSNSNSDACLRCKAALAVAASGTTSLLRETQHNRPAVQPLSDGAMANLMGLEL